MGAAIVREQLLLEPLKFTTKILRNFF